MFEDVLKYHMIKVFFSHISMQNKRGDYHYLLWPRLSNNSSNFRTVRFTLHPETFWPLSINSRRAFKQAAVTSELCTYVQLSTHSNRPGQMANEWRNSELASQMLRPRTTMNRRWDFKVCRNTVVYFHRPLWDIVWTVFYVDLGFADGCTSDFSVFKFHATKLIFLDRKKRLLAHATNTHNQTKNNKKCQVKLKLKLNLILNRYGNNVTGMVLVADPGLQPKPKSAPKSVQQISREGVTNK